MSKTVRACTNCVRAKAKCLPNHNGCERCLRLHKTCTPSPPLRRQQPISRLSVGHVHALEAKLDSLASLLSQCQPQLQSPAETLPECPEPSPLSPATDDELTLTLFQRHFLPFLPLVVLDTTAAQLQQDKPLLWAAIAAVATPCASRQRQLSLQMRHIVAREAFVKGTCSLDFLLALMVYAVWDRHREHKEALATNLIQQAVAIVYELGLHEPPPKDPAVRLAYDVKCILQPVRLTRRETVEERRALLACYTLSSLPWTAYLDECVSTLEAHKEADDLLLCQLAKLRLIVDTANTAYCHAYDPSHQESALLHLHSLTHRLGSFKAGIPPSLAQNKLLRLQRHHTEMVVHDIGLRDSLFTGPSQARVDCLQADLAAARNWVDVFLTLQPCDYYGLPFSVFTQMNRWLVVALRLNTCDCPGWDMNLFREQVDVPAAFNAVVNHFSRVRDEVPLDTTLEADVFSLIAAKIEARKEALEARLGYLPSFWDLQFDELVGIDYNMLL
ncbi:hypothetical protein ASPZODRAFT_125305 [Penicilliopsis zonata CBS 506.65]|uniref:Zn(2)-C6 fungal-type domain-containing protein n=1 Tax=Penicilliopsis zonata CBS 506.65 TaxID=1073090 RepID=A0A1L9S602_9EURO|nr:hypothetical protein ASPZODRAFT_125305 [Penicilliopsis zonata CBS 506.65]OJJ42586.1 hypothetical protein ASPZODRAFT_125305 [Penicilliopsis zonata CBS 506.65]